MISTHSSSTSHCHRSLSVGSTSSSTQQLADIVVTAAQSGRRSTANSRAANIAQLCVSDLKLHGRDDAIKLLRNKIRQLAKKKDEKDNDEKEHAAAPNYERRDESNNDSNLILVSGISGTGKSALIRKGLGEPAAKNGYAFASGKFDEKLLRPLSAFSDAMASLAKYILAERKNGGLSSSEGLSTATLIREKIRNEFDEEDVEQLRRVLPGCAELLGLGAESRRPSLRPNVATLLRSTSDSSVSIRMNHLAGKEVRRASGKEVRRSSISKLGSLNILAGKESISQMHFAIRRLLKIMCSTSKGVILFIDDLQWSDTATLDLLKSIVLNAEIPNLLIVGAYREDEVPDYHPLALHIRDLEQMNVSIAKINIGNLSVDNVLSLVAEALRMDDNDNEVKLLAETIHNKTEGNPFFVLTFLRSLHDEKLLQYNFGAMKWTWDDEAVKSKIVTENVASVLVNKMNRLQEETQRVLMVASCLGATFRLSAVLEVMNNIPQIEMRKSMKDSMSSVSCSLLTSDLSVYDIDEIGCDSSYASSIEELEVEGLCEVDDEECHFVHDQIQSAAFKLISPDQRDSFRGRIGNILLHRLSPGELEDNLFEVVGLLNCASSNEECLVLARMNLKAGIKASENAAFDAAKYYLKAGREALGSRGWEDDHSTMLDLCSHGANACFLTGDFNTMYELIEEVLSKDIDMKEKFGVSDIKVKSLISAGKYNECIDVALDFRRQLGLPTLQKKPVSKLIIIREYIRVKRLLKNTSAEDIARLPALDDEKIEMSQRMNDHLGASIYHVEPTMFPLIIFQMVTTSFMHGLNSSSSSGFAALGMMLCGHFGKPHEGLEMVKAAELILEMPGMSRSACYTILVTQHFCYHWVSPLQDTIAPLLNGYQIGLQSGEIDAAGFCLIVRSCNLYFIGRPLESIQEELEATIPVLTQMKQDDTKLKITILLTTVKKLRGIDVEAGDKFCDSALATAASTGNATITAHVNLMKLEVFVFFQEWREAIDLVRKASDDQLPPTGTFTSVRYAFLEALTYLKAAQTASGWKKRLMKKSAHRKIKIIRGWAKNGNVNVVHYLYILEAELAVLNGNNKRAKEKFKSAISTSCRNGFLQDRALAHELASAYFQSQGDDYWGDYHIERSRTCYQEWGCSEKVKQLSCL